MTLTAIITPIHANSQNRLDLLEQTLRSTLRLPDHFIHVVVDDGSPMPVEEVLAGYRSDRRVHLIVRDRDACETATPSYAQNFGINLLLDGGGGSIPTAIADAVEYFTSLHSDDLMVDLAHRVRACSSDGVGASFGDLIKFDGHRYAKLQKVEDVDSDILISEGKVGKINFHTLMWTRDFVTSMRRLNRQLCAVDGPFVPLRYAEDRAVTKLTTLAASKTGQRVAYVRQLSTLYRVHGDTLTQTIDAARLELDRATVDQLYYPQARRRHARSSTARSIYLKAYRPFKPLMRRISSRFKPSPWLESVNSIIREIDHSNNNR